MQPQQQVPKWQSRLRYDILHVIEHEKYKARRKYNKIYAWWDPTKAAFYDKVEKRFTTLHALGRTMPEDKPEKLAGLLRVALDYRDCIVMRGWNKTPVNERECYDKNLLAYLKPDETLVKAEAAVGYGRSVQPGDGYDYY